MDSSPTRSPRTAEAPGPGVSSRRPCKRRCSACSRFSSITSRRCPHSCSWPSARHSSKRSSSRGCSAVADRTPVRAAGPRRTRKLVHIEGELPAAELLEGSCAVASGRNLMDHELSKPGDIHAVEADGQCPSLPVAELVERPSEPIHLAFRLRYVPNDDTIATD